MQQVRQTAFVKNVPHTIIFTQITFVVSSFLTHRISEFSNSMIQNHGMARPIINNYIKSKNDTISGLYSVIAHLIDTYMISELLGNCLK